MGKDSNNVQDAISDLASLRPNWTLLADTIPADFLRQVKAEIESLTVERDTYLGSIRGTFRVLELRGQAPDDNAPLEVTVRRVMDYLDRVTAERDALVAELSALKKLAAPKKRVRNPEAQCRNCPYYSGFFKEHGYGVCCKDPGTDENTPKMLEGGFCGQHPDFWKEEACDTK